MDRQAQFVVVGGGTAGWIAAFILQDAARRKGLNAKISVIEPSKIPTVGVGEGTTAAFRLLLKHFGIDEFEFIRETGATIKLGIRHQDWRRKGHSYDGPIDDPHQVLRAPAGAPSDYLNVYATAAGRSLTDMHLFGPLLAQTKAPFARKTDGSLIPLGPFHYGYHFDQALVGRFFAGKSKGVEIIDAVVAGVQRDAESGDVTALELDNGQTLAADFVIDATGFRKQLIVKEMGVSWTSYAHELPVNRALPFWIDIKPGEEIANYTKAWAQDSGWMWQTPTQTRYGCGYVYSDQFATPEQAKAEVEASLGHEIEVRADIRFDIGRLDRAWIGNVLAVGLSSSFLEPLESTSIHGTIVQMMLFADRHMKDPSKISDADRADYNGRVGRQVDDFRTFINMHYMVERDDTPFWREVRANRIHPETQERLALWKTAMPRHEHFDEQLFGLPHVQSQLYYPILDGLGLLDQNLARREMEADPKLRQFARQAYDGLVKEYRAAASQALGHAAFLEIVRGMG
ncbi:tryptophan halogenase family protein [Devosia neptuniae]|mgnify:CR=1 FL=1|jgi:glycine/D-amino acid oxidase-like deaminating enzyme|uniref:tryptophan halogenase family protein n=1 Tax=Devosia TaxID=46913 RepID=UPI0022AEBEBB|nr:tryptophan halogenase family protein [Devosia neptuniae]MCZ4346562.1 tryptophan 7-halogenase [Devosia neptuniae]|tara:strand:- start:53090 stop:54631 length:1542 start_codon:yes stop_codon:yes gene_type:complete